MPKKPTKAAAIDSINSMESQLAGTLRPVAPSRDFVQGLRGRIRLPVPNELVTRLRDWHLVVIVVGIVTSATLVIVTIARAFYTLFGNRTEDTDSA